jgi:hypothetical protein
VRSRVLRDLDQGPWHTAASQNEYDIYIDSNGDGIADTVTFNTRLTGTDIFVDETIDLSNGHVVDEELINDRFADTDTALLGSDTLVMPVETDALPGVAPGSSRIAYGVVTFGQFSGDPVDTVGLDSNGDPDGSLSTDVLNPGVSVFGDFTGDSSPLLYQDMPGTSLTIRRTGTCTVTLSAATTVTATFAADVTLSVALAGSGSGSVTSSPSGIDCGATCSHAFASGTSVTLTATADSGSSFAGWSGGGCSGTGTCQVTLTAATSVTASFAKNKKDTTPPKVTSVKVKVNHGAKSAKVTFHGTDPGNGSKGLKFKCKLDKGSFKSCKSPKTYKHLSHGKHTVQVKAIDKAGNVSKTVKKKFTV